MYDESWKDVRADQICALVIDDDQAMRALVAQILGERGHIAVTAESAEEGLSYLPHYTFQVAYLDHNLPGTEGMVLGEWLRKNNPHMEIALVTGDPSEELESLCDEHGISFIAKPFDVRDITRLVERYLRRAQERMESEKEERPRDYDPPIARYVDGLHEYFDMPSLPARIEDMLVRRTRDAIAHLHSIGRYNERDRVAALAGLLTARVLGVRLPKGRKGQSLYEEYDRLMRDYGRRPEFSEEHEEE